VLDFSMNLNPLGPPDSLAAALSPDHVLRYPEPGSATLCRALAERHAIDPASVLVTNGACEAIELVMASLAPRRVVVLAPAFTEYEDAARAWGHEVVTLAAREADDFRWPLDQLDLGSQPLGPDDLLVLGNPASPSGVLSAVPELDCMLLVDETYMDFVEQPASVIGRPRTLVVRSFTKLFACPGLRLGYLVGDVAAQRARQPAWSVSRLAQSAGQAMLAETDYQEFTRRFVRARREELTAQLKSIAGIKVFSSAANFLLLRVAGARAVAQRLHQRGIAVRLGDNFTGLEPDAFLRVAVRKRSENQRLVEALTEAVHAAC
ncbi:MAG TPA: aminotransferase class I/II-fold pyridoxal phosphate-dependent enzyme, partial [Pirellulales bacterium]